MGELKGPKEVREMARKVSFSRKQIVSNGQVSTEPELEFAAEFNGKPFKEPAELASTLMDGTLSKLNVL